MILCVGVQYFHTSFLTGISLHVCVLEMYFTGWLWGNEKKFFHLLEIKMSDRDMAIYEYYSFQRTQENIIKRSVMQ